MLILCCSNAVMDWSACLEDFKGPFGTNLEDALDGFEPVEDCVS